MTDTADLTPYELDQLVQSLGGGSLGRAPFPAAEVCHGRCDDPGESEDEPRHICRGDDCLAVDV